MATLLTTASHFAAATTTTTAAVPAKSSKSLPQFSATLQSCSISFPSVKLNPVSSSSSIKLCSTLLTAKQSQMFVYPDPDPEFALSETKKFRMELVKKLSMEKATFGNDLHAEMFNEFLLTEYGGPGTLLVEPFTNMMITLNEKNLPGAPLAARTSLLWAQSYLDQDWVDWKPDGS